MFWVWMGAVYFFELLGRNVSDATHDLSLDGARGRHVSVIISVRTGLGL